MNRLLNSSLGTPICLILGLVMLGCAIYYFIKFRRETKGNIKQSIYQSAQIDIQAIQRNELTQVLKKWLPAIFF